MNTFTVSYNGKIHKSIEDEKLIDSVERIFHMFDKEITHWSYSITDKTAGKVRKYKRGKVLFKNLQNNKLEWVSFYALPEDYRTACFDIIPCMVAISSRSLKMRNDGRRAV